MNYNDFKDIEMTSDEKISAVSKLKNELEENFVQLGQLLSEMKKSKLYKYKGFKNFKQFVEAEFNFKSSFANKIIANFNLFVKELALDEQSVKEIGLDKLNMIKPIVKKSAYTEKDNWIKKAQELPTSELREELKEEREKRKSKEKTLREVFTEQYIEKMVTYFNCSRKELNFKLALFFQDRDLDEIQASIQQNHRKFEAESEQ